MAIDFTNSVDITADINDSYDSEDKKECLNFQLYLSDNEYKELLARSGAELDYDYVMRETDTTFDVTASAYKDREPKLLFTIQSEDLGWSDYFISLSDTEKETLLNELKKTVQEKFGTSLDEYINEVFPKKEQMKK